MGVQVYLTRRNLETLLKKLNGNRVSHSKSWATIIKRDTTHPVYPQTGSDCVIVTAVEDEDYYTDRAPGITLEDVVTE